MKIHYERFNELAFEVYCKTSIDNAIARERKRKATRAKREQPFSSLPDAVLYSIGRLDPELDNAETEPVIFHIKGRRVLMNDTKLGQALTLLLPKDREIVILRYFVGMREERIARELKISRATVNRRLRNAETRMRTLMEEST